MNYSVVLYYDYILYIIPMVAGSVTEWEPMPILLPSAFLRERTAVL